MEKDHVSILVVDPHEGDHESLNESLRRSSVPATVTFTSNAQNALPLLKKNDFDLIITDHHLPQTNAFHILSETRDYHPQTPVILLTRNADPKTARDAFQKGMDDFLLKEELSSISMFDIIGNCIEKRRLKQEEEEGTQRLKELAERDGLTGLYNHRFLIDALEKEFTRAKRYHRPLSVVIVDLDGFKSINDTCGHPQGDQVIKQVGQILLQTVRFVDIAARYGGDEFVLVLPETGLRDAQNLATRILKEIKAHPFFHEGKSYPLSASIGIAEYTIAQNGSANILKEADEALYQAKKTGRSRIVVSGYIKPTALFRRSFAKNEDPITLS